MKKKTKKVNRSAIDGKFVSDEYAEAHPATTVSDTVPINADDSKDVIRPDLSDDGMGGVTNEHLAE